MATSLTDRLTLRVPLDMLAWARRKAERSGTSLAAVILAALRQAMETDLDPDPIPMGRPKREAQRGEHGLSADDVEDGLGEPGPIGSLASMRCMR